MSFAHSLNLVIGRLGKNPTPRHTTNATPVSNIDLTERRWGKGSQPYRQQVKPKFKLQSIYGDNR